MTKGGRISGRMGGLGLAGLVAAAGVGLGVQTAHAQIRLSVSSTMPMGGGEGEVSKRSVEKYAQLLGLSAEQKDTAMVLHDGYAAAYGDARKAQRKVLEDARHASEDSDGRGDFMQKLQAAQKDFREKTTKLNKGFLSDLKSLLTPEQEGRWVKVERLRRREQGLRGGGVSGAGVDLVEVVDSLKLTGEQMAAVSPALDEYEIDMDRQLVEKIKAAEDAPGFEPGKFDPAKFKERMKQAHDEGVRIKDVNDRSARKIEPLLPEDKRTAFRDAVKERSFPQVYRPSRAARSVEAALKLDDLTGEQRQSLQALRSSYRHDITPLNEAWASAISGAEADGQSGAFMGSDGSAMVLNFGEDPPALADARKARHDLDDRTLEKMKGILNDKQTDKVDKAAEADNGGDMEVDGAVQTVIIGGHP